MGLIDGLTKNMAEQEPVLMPMTLPDAVEWTATRINEAPRWAVVAVDVEGGTLHATRTTRLWRFVDDIHLFFEAHGEGTRVSGRSRSRIGKGDFGQNARNLRQVAALLRSAEAQVR